MGAVRGGGGLKAPWKRPRVLPGFGLTLGYTLFYLSVIVLIPLSTLFLKSATLGASGFWAAVTAPRVLASYKLTLGASLAGAGLNALFGLIVAWGLGRHRLPGPRRGGAPRGLPLSLPPAVARHGLAPP